MKNELMMKKLICGDSEYGCLVLGFLLFYYYLPVLRSTMIALIMVSFNVVFVMMMNYGIY